MLKKLLYISVISLSSCTEYYYSVPFSQAPVLEKQGDVDIGLNAQKGNGYEYGFRAAVLPFRNIYTQFNWQRGDFPGSREMSYSYNELSLGYTRDFGMLRLSSGLYYGLGTHRINYPASSYAANDPMIQTSRLEQFGAQLSGYLELDEDFIVVGTGRIHRFALGKIRRSGNVDNKMIFNDPQKAALFSPSLGIIYTHDFFNFGFHSGMSLALNKEMPHLKYRYGFISFAVNLNYKDIFKR